MYNLVRVRSDVENSLSTECYMIQSVMLIRWDQQHSSASRRSASSSTALCRARYECRRSSRSWWRLPCGRTDPIVRYDECTARGCWEGRSWWPATPAVRRCHVPTRRSLSAHGWNPSGTPSWLSRVPSVACHRASTTQWSLLLSSSPSASRPILHITIDTQSINSNSTCHFFFRYLLLIE